MGLFGDIKEIKDSWDKSSLPLKIISAVILFTSLSSITSLADQVFKWRGFILEALTFYKTVIVDPIKSIFGFLQIKLTEEQVDIFLVTSMCLSSIMRYYALHGKLFKIFHEAPINKRATSVLVGVTSTITTFFLMMEEDSNNPMRYETAFFMITCVTFFYFDVTPFKVYFKFSIKKVMTIWSPILISIIIILILAAINEGLTRSI